jgi:hypothetical protein
LAILVIFVILIRLGGNESVKSNSFNSDIYLITDPSPRHGGVQDDRKTKTL